MIDEEAIKGLQNIVEYWTIHPHEQECAETAISALRERIERSDPQPLTMEELRKVREGVLWCSDTDGINPGIVVWCEYVLEEGKGPHIWLTDNEGNCGKYEILSMAKCGAKFYCAKPQPPEQEVPHD